MKKLIVLLLLLTACSDVDTEYCPDPYSLVEDYGCCLDDDNNSVCDPLNPAETPGPNIDAASQAYDELFSMAPALSNATSFQDIGSSQSLLTDMKRLREDIITSGTARMLSEADKEVEYWENRVELEIIEADIWDLVEEMNEFDTYTLYPSVMSVQLDAAQNNLETYKGFVKEYRDLTDRFRIAERFVEKHDYSNDVHVEDYEKNIVEMQAHVTKTEGNIEYLKVEEKMRDLDDDMTVVGKLISSQIRSGTSADDNVDKFTDQQEELISLVDEYERLKPDHTDYIQEWRDRIADNQAMIDSY